MTVEPPHWFKGEKGSRVQSPHERVTVIAESLSAPQETAGRCHCGFGCEKTREGVVRRSQETCLTVENGPPIWHLLSCFTGFWNYAFGVVLRWSVLKPEPR